MLISGDREDGVSREPVGQKVNGTQNITGHEHVKMYGIYKGSNMSQHLLSYKLPESLLHMI